MNNTTKSINPPSDELCNFIVDKLGISEQSGGNGYRLIANAGKDSHQEVPHLHFHLLAGRPLGPMVFPEKPKYT